MQYINSIQNKIENSQSEILKKCWKKLYIVYYMQHYILYIV